MSDALEVSHPVPAGLAAKSDVEDHFPLKKHPLVGSMLMDRRVTSCFCNLWSVPCLLACLALIGTLRGLFQSISRLRILSVGSHYGALPVESVPALG